MIRQKIYHLTSSYKENLVAKVSLNRGFMEGFMVYNIINFADILRRDNDGVSWDVRRVLSP